MKFLESIWKAAQPQPFSLSFSMESFTFVRWVFTAWQTPALSRGVDLSSVCITLQLVLLTTVMAEGETISFFSIGSKSPPAAHLAFAWEVVPLGRKQCPTFWIFPVLFSERTVRFII